MQLHLFRSSCEWSLYNIIFDIIILLKPFNFIQWFILTVISITLTTYLNVSFFATISTNVNQGLIYLFLLIIFDNITSYCSLKQCFAKRTFVLDFLKHFRTKLTLYFLKRFQKSH